MSLGDVRPHERLVERLLGAMPENPSPEHALRLVVVLLVEGLGVPGLKGVGKERSIVSAPSTGSPSSGKTSGRTSVLGPRLRPLDSSAFLRSTRSSLSQSSARPSSWLPFWPSALSCAGGQASGSWGIEPSCMCMTAVGKMSSPSKMWVPGEMRKCDGSATADVDGSGGRRTVDNGCVALLGLGDEEVDEVAPDEDVEVDGNLVEQENVPGGLSGTKVAQVS